MDRSGNMYTSDIGSHTVRRISKDGIITLYAGVYGSTSNPGSAGVPALQAQFQFPYNVHGDSSGNVYVADTQHCMVRIIKLVDQKVYPFIGTGTCGSSGDTISSTTANMLGPSGVFVDSGNNRFAIDCGTSTQWACAVSVVRVVFDVPMPTSQPTQQPSRQPTRQPSSEPTSPTGQPTDGPSSQPSQQPTKQPVARPSSQVRRPCVCLRDSTLLLMNLPAAAVIPTEQAAHDATQPPTHHATESTAHQAPDWTAELGPDATADVHPDDTANGTTQPATHAATFRTAHQAAHWSASGGSHEPTDDATFEAADAATDRYRHLFHLLQDSAILSTFHTSTARAQVSRLASQLGAPRCNQRGSRQVCCVNARPTTKSPTSRILCLATGQPSVEPSGSPTSQPTRRPSGVFVARSSQHFSLHHLIL
jgi:hypothetical protein